MRTLLMLVLACCSLGVFALEPVKITDAKDQEILKHFLVQVAAVPTDISPKYCQKMVDDECEGYTWQICPYLDMPLTAYKLTGDVKYLEDFVKTFANMSTTLTSGPDGFKGWYGKPLPIFSDKNNPGAKTDVMINCFHATEVLTDFIETIAAEPALAEKYAAQKKEYLDLLENHFVKAWLDRGNLADLGKLGAAFRAEFTISKDKGGLTHPHNKQSICVRGLCGLYRVTGKDEYLALAIKLATCFKHSLTLKAGHYEWNYWDPAGEWDIDPENPKYKWRHWIGVEHKGGYYASSLAQAVEMYDFGLVFNRTDLDRFLKTQLELCWDGKMDKPGWSRVDGTKSDKYMQGEYICEALAPYSAKVQEYLFTGPRQDHRIKVADNNWHGGPMANYWLKAKLLELPSKPDGKQKYLEFGKKFLAKPENAALVKELEFTASEPNYVAPESPKDAKDLPKTPPAKTASAKG